MLEALALKFSWEFTGFLYRKWYSLALLPYTASGALLLLLLLMLFQTPSFHTRRSRFFFFLGHKHEGIYCILCSTHTHVRHDCLKETSSKAPEGDFRLLSEYLCIYRLQYWNFAKIPESCFFFSFRYVFSLLFLGAFFAYLRWSYLQFLITCCFSLPFVSRMQDIKCIKES